MATPDRWVRASIPGDLDVGPYHNHPPDDTRGVSRIVLAWIEELQDNGNVVVDTPPLQIVRYPDLLEKGWGWERLLPYELGPVTWSTYKGYLKDYFNKRKDDPAILCAPHKLDPAGKEFLDDPLQLAASMCIKVEEELLNCCLSCLTSEHIQLSHEIMDRARKMIDSHGESLTAAAGFMCITKEAELICCLSKLNDNTTGLIGFSNDIRQSALNLLLSEVPESAAAMVGITKEAMLMRCHLSNDQTFEDLDLYEQYIICQDIRESISTVLFMLEDESCIKTTSGCTPSVKSEEPIGIATASELKHKESDAKDNNLKRKKRKFKNGKRWNKNLNNVTGRELHEKKRKREKRRRLRSNLAFAK